MAKINRKDVYPDDVIISMLDFLLGSDANNSGKTKSYPVQGLADFFLAYVLEHVDGLDQDNRFRFEEVNIMIGGRGFDISTPELKEAAIADAINGYFSNNQLEVSEKDLIVFVFQITEYGTFKKHTRKFLFPHMLGKGIYNPMSDSFTYEDLHLIFIDVNYYQATPVDIENDVNNVVFDLGDITGENYLNYINTISNPLYPTGYPLIDNTKIYYFKWVNDGVTYMYYFDEANSTNSYNTYGIDGNFTFDFSELIIFYQSNSVPDPLGLHAVAYSGNYNDLINVPNQHFKGKYTSLVALQTAYPTANTGDYGQVDSGLGSDVVNYNWDDEEGWIVGSSGSGATDTDSLPEGSTNLYFTFARVLSTVLSGLSASSGTFTSSDTILTAFGKIKYLIDNIASIYATIASPTFTGTVTAPEIIVSGETTSRVAIIDSSKKIKSADTTTYPSLTELAYVKGLSSNAQTQLTALGLHQIKITTSSNISTTTQDGSGNGQNGRNVLVANGATAISYDCNGTITTTIVKLGSAAITFNQGSGRTLIVNGVATSSGSLNGVSGSMAALTSDGTTDYLSLTNY